VIRVAALQKSISKAVRDYQALTLDSRKHLQKGVRQEAKTIAAQKRKLSKLITKHFRDLCAWLGARGPLPPFLAVDAEACKNVPAILKSGVCPWECVARQLTIYCHPLLPALIFAYLYQCADSRFRWASYSQEQQRWPAGASGAAAQRAPHGAQQSGGRDWPPQDQGFDYD